MINDPLEDFKVDSRKTGHLSVGHKDFSVGHKNFSVGRKDRSAA